MPAFVVLHDTTLEDIFHKRPHSLAELREVRGIGDVKAEKYGRQILGVVTGGDSLSCEAEHPTDPRSARWGIDFREPG